ncbi:uncharacterized protein BJ171DRAFT_21219 [Polychytrium aggregatum]|uniref:uncharacterized protein n=1 Tax=Polychytrium aggregatum TaxID=110093 RepID=UPI0022FE55A3|nr:uncharacterized protein BJ171DRAFT_21219 [Polychytrium aggregatum]KAI9192996.1 hypothetical protein BJ171DRAFT_21219 [Polychytrium aggregatum]
MNFAQRLRGFHDTGIELRRRRYHEILELCCHEMTMRASNGLYMYFEVPLMVAGCPAYDINECVAYIQQSLCSEGVSCDLFMPPNILFISWSADHSPDPKPSTQSLTVPTQPLPPASPPPRQLDNDLELDINPTDPVSTMNFTVGLMRSNPRYNHLFDESGTPSKKKNTGKRTKHSQNQ